MFRFILLYKLNDFDGISLYIKFDGKHILRLLTANSYAIVFTISNCLALLVILLITSSRSLAEYSR